jgi:hypothetical protein
VLDGDEFVSLLPGLDEGHMQADFKFLGNHGHFLWAGGDLKRERLLGDLTGRDHHLGWTRLYSTGSLRHCSG